MPKCCIVMCSARKNKNQPQLTLHRFPKNEALKEKWLEAIGKENINPRQKNWHLCSLHFKDSCFNKTLNVIRLRENSLPTIFPYPRTAIQDTSVLCETSNVKTAVASTSAASFSFPLPLQEEVNVEVAKCKKIKTLKDKCLKQQKKIKCLNEKLRRKEKKIATLKDVIEDLRQKSRINMEQGINM
ncbi:unnamed protein product [Chilo suppressalis]|uniref:THAP-type domain-containing protein n=1 Tax=Chilo suppressalis TaxID=168631 RepID=A0ABN8AZX0_CHISP|nr:unnamed protein product [Chilo suppressalis]